jgi:hypothetical protein
MAEETKKETAASASTAAEEVVTVPETKTEEAAPSEEKNADEPAPAAVAVKEKAFEAEKKSDEDSEEEKKAEDADEAAAADEAAVIDGTGSFKEESNLVSELPDPERTALAQFKELVAAARANGEFDLPPPPPAQPTKDKEEAKDAAPPKEEEPKPEVTAAEETTAEASAPEEPKAETSAPEEPAKEEPKVEEPVKEEHKAEEPKAETLPAAAVEEPKAEAAGEAAKPAEPEEKTVAAAEEGTTKAAETIEETAAAAEPDAAPAQAAEPKEELIWGVPLVGDDERTDTVLLKFLRAREFKVKEALAMLKSAVLWRKRFGIDAVLDADLGLPELENVVFYRGLDREGHPVCYNVYGEFQDKELYEKAFGDEEKRERFLKWRIQLLEHGIREQLDFSSSGICSMVQVTDLKNSPPMLGKHRSVTRQALALLQDNYPEFIAKKVLLFQ